MEALAKDMLLLNLFCDSSIPIRQRAIQFLEVFGNVLLQGKTEQWLEDSGFSLRSWICEDCGSFVSKRFDDLVDISLLKFRERDELEQIFQSWCTKTNYDVQTLLDYRLRNFYSDRYDRLEFIVIGLLAFVLLLTIALYSRTCVLDWDYQMKVKELASIIHVKQYRDWRLKGVAFEYGSTEYNRPNRTFMSYVDGVMKCGSQKGMNKPVLGYWCDILVGPYVSFGIKCDTTRPFVEDLFYVVNKGTGSAQHRHHAAEIATYNLVEMMYSAQVCLISTSWIRNLR